MTLTISAGFLLKVVGFGLDAFYFGIMLYNSGLAIGFQYLKKHNLYPLFTKELARFAQVNLVLSTVLLLFFFEDHVYNGFNLLLTACIYLAMIYVSGKKGYHFVFSIMLVYGAYQILENWGFEGGNPVGFALIGLLFLAVPRFVADRFGLQKAFRWTSAVVSILAFLFISFKGLVLRADEASLILLLAYLIIAGNFTYLANIEINRLFRFLSPIFLASALFEGVRILDHWIEFITFSLPIFYIGFVLFLIGWIVSHKWLLVLKQSMRDVGFCIMVIPMLVCTLFSQWGELGQMLLLLAIVFYLMLKIDRRKSVQVSAPWLTPISLGLAIVCFGAELLQESVFYQERLGGAFHFAGAGGVVLVAGLILYKLKIKVVTRSTFFTGIGFYSLGLLYSLFLPMDEMIVRPFLWLAGSILFYLLYRIGEFIWVKFVVSGFTLVFYFMVQIPLHDHFHFTQTIDSFVLEGGGVLLLLISLLILKKDRELAKGFAWVGHLYLVPALLLTYFVFGEESTWPLFITVGIYVTSVRFVQVEWAAQLFLYGAFTTLFMTMDAGIRLFVGGNNSQYAFLLTSVLIGGYWVLAKGILKRHAYFYLIPFSFIGLMTFLSIYPFVFIHYIVLVCYAVGLLVLLQLGNWVNLVFFPLLIVLAGTLDLIHLSNMNIWVDLFLLATIGLVLLFAGKWLYQRSWMIGEKPVDIKVDGYSILAFFFFVTIGFFWSETFWAGVIHGLLISLALWFQRHRVPNEIRFIFTFLAGAYLFIPYYTILNEFKIHPLWEREAWLLPWVMLLIFLQVILKGRWKKITNYLQWAVLVVVSLLLIQDGLASSTINDALILGSLSLIAMLAGMWLRVKAYFFIGSGVLLLNVFLQTRPFWGHLPWWGYLLIVGTLLITVASFNEWNKQKLAKGEKTFIVKVGEKIIQKLKQWN